ncbi:MAG: hypothetical protein ACREWG_12520 [Gammaproteobacteria bacterium]
MLRASAKILVGFGTAPLIIKGGVFVAGELDLVVVSISAHGDLVLEARETSSGGGQDVAVKIEGEFCGEVDLFFFSLEGCVGVSIDLSPDLEPPPPASPVKGISLTDRRDRIMGVATRGEPAAAAVFNAADPEAAAAVDSNNTVWPDTAPVIHFSHYVANALPSIAQFSPGPTPTQPKWFGSSELKYAYRLDGVQLVRRDGDVLGDTWPLQSVWTATPYRQPDSSGDDNPLPSEHEGPNLKLLDWDPWAWVVNMDTGGAGQDGDPAETIAELCDPKPVPKAACVFGRAARRAGLHGVRIRQELPAPPPYPSRFFVTGEPVIRIGASRLTGRGLQTVAERLGGHLLAGAVVGLGQRVTIAGVELTTGYRLPAARQILSDGLRDLTLPWEGLFDQRVTGPAVTLLICDAPAQSKGDGGEPDELCDDFDGVKPQFKAIAELQRPAFTLRAIGAQGSFGLVDDVDQSGATPVPGSDGDADVRCSRVEIHVMLFTGKRIEGTAYAADGTALDRGRTPNQGSVPQVLAFKGDAIATLRVVGGGGGGVIFKICCHPAEPATDKLCESFDRLKPSDRTVATLTHNGFKFAVIDRATRLRAIDAVDETVAAPRPGNDGAAEIGFPRSGVRIDLKQPCPIVEVHVMLFNPERVEGEGLDAKGKAIATARSGTDQRVAQVLSFMSGTGDPIATITLKGGAGEAVIYKICCVKGATTAPCVTFDGLRPAADGVARLEHRDHRFESLSGGRDLRLVDVVNTAPESDRPGRDKIPELGFTSAGMRIMLPAPCAAVELKLMLFASEPVKAVALNAVGTRVARGETTNVQRVPQVIRLEGADLRVVELTGGAGEAVLYEICYHDAAATKKRQRTGATPQRATPLDDPGLVDVTVTGIIDDELRDAWPGRVIEEKRGGKDRRCVVMVFTPRDAGAGPWDGFRIVPPVGKTVTLVAVCGIDKRAADARDNDTAVQTQLRDVLSNAIDAAPEERREILLDPGAQYEIRVSWSWKAWQADDPGDTPPDPNVDPAPWTSGGTDILRFATAPESTLTGAQQDGLNEHVFDARDIDRYLIGVEPADGRGVHFTGDPIWLHFDCGHVEQLLELYDRTLVIEVRRTDPPPQATPETLTTALEPIAVEMEWMDQPQMLAVEGDRRLNAAVLTAPCLPRTGAPFGGASLAVTAALEPNAAYDLTVIAPIGSDRPVVRATRFQTSRYADPRALIQALGYRIGAKSPYLPDDLLIPDPAITLPSDGFIEGAADAPRAQPSDLALLAE